MMLCATYNIFRWYRAGWGRYSQGDPIGLSGGLNLLGYTNSGHPGIEWNENGIVT